MKSYKLQCEILSPVHIGNGQEIDPLSYIIKEENLYYISFDDFVLNMEAVSRCRFEELLEKNDLTGMRSFVADTIDLEKETIYSTSVDYKVAGIYKSKIRDIRNQLRINPFIRTGDQKRPLIPGSSIKGAIRTALISELAQNSNLPRPKGIKEEYQFESKVLRYQDGKEDPLRGIKIRDAQLEKHDTIVRDVKNVSRDSGRTLKSNNIQIFCEMTHSTISGKSTGFESTLNIDNSLYQTKYLKKTFTTDDIIRSCAKFYKDKMTEEHNRFYRGSDLENYSKMLMETPLDNKSFLLRVGRFSGVESVTLDKYRNPKPPGKKNTWGTTRNLADGQYPMGWIKGTFLEN